MHFRRKLCTLGVETKIEIPNSEKRIGIHLSVRINKSASLAWKSKNHKFQLTIPVNIETKPVINLRPIEK